MVSIPVGHAADNVHTFYYNTIGTTIDTCATICKPLATSTGTANTGTGIHNSNNQGFFILVPNTPNSGTTGTEGSTPQGSALEYGTDLGGLTIQSGTWQFDVTSSASSATGTAFWHFQVFSCLTNGLGTCTKLFTYDDTTQNVLSSTSSLKRTYTSPNVGPFSTVHFLVLEIWLDVTVAGQSGSGSVSLTTVDASSDMLTPGWNYPQGLSASITMVSSLVEKNSIFKSLTGSVTIASSLAHLDSIFRSLSASLQTASSFSEKNSIFKTLAASITFTMGSMVANVNSELGIRLLA
ncbi:MAG: hypothetical protein E6K87_08165 [Thaumarchaeota archaeon]|nr:MAG: hypothetical protein E6K87_08165 [Nitrososphaerota archaeon]